MVVVVIILGFGYWTRAGAAVLLHVKEINGLIGDGEEKSRKCPNKRFWKKKYIMKLFRCKMFALKKKNIVTKILMFPGYNDPLMIILITLIILKY